MQRTIVLLCVVFALMLAGHAAAQSQNHKVYGFAAVGYSALGDAQTSIGGVNVDVEYKGQVSGFGGFGYDINKMLSVEAEVSYRAADVDSARTGGATITNPMGDVSKLAFMVNGVVQFGEGAVRPYFGGGVGAVVVEVDPTGSAVQSVHADETALAYQFIGGLGFSVTDKLMLAADYRYFGHGDIEVTDQTGATADAEVDGDHTFTIGFRYRF